MSRAFVLLLVFTLSCSEPENAPTVFTYADAAGIWKIYESETDDGVINTSDALHSENLFGAYNGDVQLHADQRYTPMTLDNQGGYSSDPSEEGTYEYIASTNTLTFSQFPQAYTLVRFTAEELHLKREGTTYKLRRV